MSAASHGCIDVSHRPVCPTGGALPPPPRPRSADQLDVVCRVALPGWDVTFLVTDTHLQRRYRRDGLVHFICQVGARQEGVRACMLGLWEGPRVCGGRAVAAGSGLGRRERTRASTTAALPAPDPLPPTLQPHSCLQFVSDLHAKLSAMKLSLRSRARAVAADYWKQLEALRLSDGGGGAEAGTGAPGCMHVGTRLHASRPTKEASSSKLAGSRTGHAPASSAAAPSATHPFGKLGPLGEAPAACCSPAWARMLLYGVNSTQQRSGLACGEIVKEGV